MMGDGASKVAVETRLPTPVPPLEIDDCGWFIARICHEANREFCELTGGWIQPHWDSAGKIVQDSVISGVKKRMENPDITAAQSHEEWRRYKEAEGWVYGEDKSLKEKTHPNLVPYDELPPEQQIKDHLFSAIVGVFAKAVQNYEEDKAK